ncbi:hypothetical protein ML462_15830 [Gramella lutea]|uniref:Uncharacterized protein n=1 Tax=Christiangramia lutea TaxID=1607951 RepID=A0A9X1V5K2_9FLAO|nr:hypothetical protein [Christiangramia lutea]MCH4824644.1 hypothetical protein [Christiangramia lutea]
MKEKLTEIFDLEAEGKYNEAYNGYQKLTLKKPDDFQIWKFYYFFLWSMLEDVNQQFNKKIDLNKELKKQLQIGVKKFSSLSEFNFIVGYTISIFPYEFGDYKEIEKKSKKMLKIATESNPDNLIYKMVFLGSQTDNVNDKEYVEIGKKAQESINTEYRGNGLLNEYFKQVLKR